MHATMLGVELLFGSSADKNKQNQDLNQLTTDEKACYEVIVKDLLRCCAERVEHPIIAPNHRPGHNRKIYALVFRQSESWGLIEENLTKIEINVQPLPQSVKEWITDWRQRIGYMRGVYGTLNTCLKELQKYKEKLLVDETFEIDKVKIRQIEDLVSQNENSIKTTLQDCFKDLDKSLKNKALKKYPACQELLNLLNKKWVHLTVFAEWPEVSIDEKRLCARVISPKLTNLNPNKNGLDDADAGQYPDPKPYLGDLSTKGFLLVGEEDIEERSVQYEGSVPGKIIRPKAMGLKKGHYNESPYERKKRSSSIKLTDELIFDYHFVEDENEKVKKVDRKKAITSLADRIECIAELALKKVNEVLTQYDVDTLNESKLDALIKESLNNDTDNTEGNSWNRSLLLSIMKPFLGLK